jgi:hypothetical protein
MKQVVTDCHRCGGAKWRNSGERRAPPQPPAPPRPPARRTTTARQSPAPAHHGPTKPGPTPHPHIPREDRTPPATRRGFLHNRPGHIDLAVTASTVSRNAPILPHRRRDQLGRADHEQHPHQHGRGRERRGAPALPTANLLCSRPLPVPATSCAGCYTRRRNITLEPQILCLPTVYPGRGASYMYPPPA